LDWSAASIANPNGIDALFKSVYYPSLVGLIDISDTEKDVIVAHGSTSDPSVQNTSKDTRTWRATTTDGLGFVVEGGSTSVFFDGYEVEVEDVQVTANLSKDGSEITDGIMTYKANVSFAVAGLGASSVEEVCEILASFSAVCEPCADGSVECIPIRWEGLAAEELSPSTVVEIE